MGIIETIRSKPHEQKVRLIWIIIVIAAVLMGVLWVATARISKNAPADTTLFKTIDRGIKDIREQYKK